MNSTNANDRFQDYLDQQEEVAETFKINDKGQANWALRKIAECKKQIKENNEFAAKEIEKIEFWKDSENEKAQNNIDFFNGLLAEFAMEQREKDPKFKYMKLPNGRIAFRKQAPKWTYDDKKLLKTLKESNMTDYIRVKEEVKKSDLKKALKVVGDKVINEDTGEVIDGITVTERGESFGVKVDE